ncbi:MAG: hypothetical protein KY442_02290 [Proteobacteria bacterium]|nr:hypothetical protein [Pseudomonadota bacterium]
MGIGNAGNRLPNVWSTADIGAPSWSHRDRAALSLLPDLMRNIEWRQDALVAALEPSMYATDVAMDLARDGVPFRDAYKQAADPAGWADGNPQQSLAARTSPGAAADLRLGALRERLGAIVGE